MWAATLGCHHWAEGSASLVWWVGAGALLRTLRARDTPRQELLPRTWLGPREEAAWVKLKDIRLGDSSRTPQDRPCVIPLL